MRLRRHKPEPEPKLKLTREQRIQRGLDRLETQVKAETKKIERREKQLAAGRERLGVLRDRRLALREIAGMPSPPKRQRTPKEKAGQGNLDLVETLLRRTGPMPKAAITRETKKNDGTTHYALRALEEEGKVRRTGDRIHGSAVYELVRAKPRPRRGVTRPGSGS